MSRPEIVDELLELRRGRGLQAEDAASRIGPHLRAACGVAETDQPAVVRRKVVLRLTGLCGHLAPDLRLAVLAGLALHEHANHQFLHERMQWVASQINRDHPRAAVRRLQKGFMLLSEYLDEPLPPDVDDAWYVETLRAMLSMDLEPPQLTEERCIVATTDELDEIMASLSAPKDSVVDESDVISAKMIYGGEIVETRQLGRGHTEFVVRLPEPLSLGERHEYSIQFTAYPRVWMRPYYVLTPLRRCEQFSLHIKFGENKPQQIWKLNGVPPRVVDDFLPNDDLLTIDQGGDVSLEFHGLKQGLSYGVSWSW